MPTSLPPRFHASLCHSGRGACRSSPPQPATAMLVAGHFGPAFCRLEEGLSKFLKVDHYLYLSGTPFRALTQGEFLEDQIYNWTYSDEQRAKKAWKGTTNPNAALPQMYLLAYEMPEKL